MGFGGRSAFLLQMLPHRLVTGSMLSRSGFGSQDAHRFPPSPRGSIDWLPDFSQAVILHPMATLWLHQVLRTYTTLSLSNNCVV